MKPVTFFIPCKVHTWNSITTTHWRTYQRLKNDHITATWAAIKEHKLKPIKGPVSVVYTAHRLTNRKFDVSNIVVKSIEDTLVREGIIEADDFTIVKEVTLRCVPKSPQGEGVEVSIRPVI